MRSIVILLALTLGAIADAAPKEMTLNCCIIANPPAWLARESARDVVERVQRQLGWDIRRIRVFFYSDERSFANEQTLGFSTRAFFRPKDQTVHVSTKVTEKNFSSVFGHELVHVIFFQKYKKAIPRWLEEGLANVIGGEEKVDYAWLAKQPLVDVTTLVHPNSDGSGSRYHYQASTAAAEMIADRCRMNDLLMLSVGKRLEDYLSTFCKIADVNASFRTWVAERGSAKKN